MQTQVLLNELGLEALVSKAIEEVREWVTAVSGGWYRRDLPPLTEEGQGQLAELITALGQEEEVVNAACSDLSAMAEWEGWDGPETFVVNVSRFSWLTDLLLRLDKTPDLRQVGLVVGATSQLSWRAALSLDRVWGEAVARHLRRQTSVTWELVEADGLVIKEAASGLSFAADGGLPSLVREPPPSVLPAQVTAGPVEHALHCKLSGCHQDLLLRYNAAIDAVRETLLAEGLALGGVETLDLQGESLYAAAEKLSCLSFSTQGSRERLALRVASNCAHERFFGR